MSIFLLRDSLRATFQRRLLSSQSTALLTTMATILLTLERLQVGDMVIVDAASPEYALWQVSKVTRTQIVCGRRRYYKANGWPVRGSGRYAIRPATSADIRRNGSAIRRRQKARQSATSSSEQSAPPCQLVAWFERDRQADPWNVQTLEQLQGLAGWLDSAES